MKTPIGYGGSWESQESPIDFITKNQHRDLRDHPRRPRRRAVATLVVRTAPHRRPTTHVRPLRLAPQRFDVHWYDDSLVTLVRAKRPFRCFVLESRVCNTFRHYYYYYQTHVARTAQRLCPRRPSLWHTTSVGDSTHVAAHDSRAVHVGGSMSTSSILRCVAVVASSASQVDVF